MALFTNIAYTFQVGLRHPYNGLDVLRMSGVAEPAVIDGSVKIAALIIAVLGIKIALDLVVSNIPHYVSEAYVKSVSEQVCNDS